MPSDEYSHCQRRNNPKGYLAFVTVHMVTFHWPRAEISSSQKKGQVRKFSGNFRNFRRKSRKFPVYVQEEICWDPAPPPHIVFSL
jgi:hypothetical protein